jgi:hypothetical protein
MTCCIYKKKHVFLSITVLTLITFTGSNYMAGIQRIQTFHVGEENAFECATCMLFYSKIKKILHCIHAVLKISRLFNATLISLMFSLLFRYKNDFGIDHVDEYYIYLFTGYEDNINFIVPRNRQKLFRETYYCPNCQ